MTPESRQKLIRTVVDGLRGETPEAIEDFELQIRLALVAARSRAYQRERENRSS